MQTHPRNLILLLAMLAAACSSAPAPAPIAAATPEAATHRGVWHWIGSTTANGALIVSDPARYSIEFTDDTTMLVQADCNRGRASYALESTRQFTPGPVGLTKMGCPPGSQDREFLAQLATARALDPRDEWLQVELAESSGTMHFARSPDTRLSQFHCAEGQPFVAAFQASALIIADGRWQLLPGVVAGSGNRFSDGAIDLHTEGDEAMLDGLGAPRRECRPAD